VIPWSPIILGSTVPIVMIFFHQIWWAPRQ